jgi:HPt (histidine-containing phosphotransfer) domain-containing protein
MVDSESRTVRLANQISAESDDRALDAGVFATLRAAMPLSSLTQIYSVFLADTRERVASLLVALDRSKISSIFPAAAHAIRGSAGMIGATAIASLAERLEQRPESLAGLLAACEQLEDRLRSEGLAL